MFKVFLQEHFINSWQTVEASSIFANVGVIHVPSSFYPDLFSLNNGRISWVLRNILWEIDV